MLEDDIHPFWKTLLYIEVEVDTNEGVRHGNIDDKEYFQSLVDEVLKADPAVVRHMFNWIEVTGNGNCGFRAIAVIKLGGEEGWPLLRRAMCMEMQTTREQYLRVYLEAETLENAIIRIGSHSKGPAPFIN